MKKFLSLTLVFVTLLSFNSVFGWGSKGHDIIVTIAYNHMTPKAKKEVNKALGGRSMVYYASWMDNVRVLPEYTFTATWHYANVDEGESYATTSPIQSGDVYTAVTDIVDKLNKRATINDSLQSFYVKALIHLVGDMHCPMHTGRRSDLGGNKFKVKWFNSPTSLHKVWDSKLLESSRSWSHSEWASNIDFESEDIAMPRYTKGTPLDWLNESINIGKQVYLNTEEDGNYSYDYIRKYSPTLELQLIRAGYRLAYLLNNIYK